MLSRRGFLKSVLALSAAPAIVKAESLMRIYVRPQTILTLYGDGMHDDTEALQAWVDGEAVLMPNGSYWDETVLAHGSFLVSKPINLSAGRDKLIRNCEFARTLPGADHPIIIVSPGAHIPRSSMFHARRSYA